MREGGKPQALQCREQQMMDDGCKLLTMARAGDYEILEPFSLSSYSGPVKHDTLG